MRNNKFLITNSFIGLFCIFAMSCTTTRNFNETYTFCYDINPSVYWVTNLDGIELVDDLNNDIEIEGKAIEVNFTTSTTEDDGYVQSTLSYLADNEVTTITALGCIVEGCYTMTPGTLKDTQRTLRTDDEGAHYDEMTFTYETTKSEPRHLSINLYIDSGYMSIERNTYTCTYDCTETEPFCLPNADSDHCATTTSCDHYTCDNGLSSRDETSDSGVTPGSDCSVEAMVHPDLPQSFTAYEISRVGYYRPEFHAGKNNLIVGPKGPSFFRYQE